jgi:hypothetical protein
MLKLSNYIVFPKGIFISDKNKIHIVSSEKQSLYKLIH